MTHCHCTRGEEPEPCCPIHGKPESTGPMVAHVCCGTVVIDGACEVCGCRNAGQYREVVLALPTAKSVLEVERLLRNSGDFDWAVPTAEQMLVKLAEEIWPRLKRPQIDEYDDLLSED